MLKNNKTSWISLTQVKARIQESDTIAHQKRRESLSPNTKASIQESNIAEQQKHQESLSPNKKACIQERDIAAHQKQWEKFMTEEEKKRENPSNT